MVTKTWSKEADVVVVGYGAAGAAAAIEAHDAGARVLILEKMPGPGGNTALSGGLVWAANTPVQRRKGIEDSAEEMFQCVLAAAEGLVDENLVKQSCYMSGANIDWLSGLGVDLELIATDLSLENEPEFAARFPVRPRVHRVTNRKAGLELMKVLRRAVENRHIEVMLRSPLRRLITNPPTKEVTGVKTDKGDIKARKAVVLATGGFGRNREMVSNYYGGRGVVNYGASGLTGDGIRAAQALGADLVSMGIVETLFAGVVSGRPSSSGEERVILAPTITSRLDGAPCLLVDKRGKRFGDEYMTYSRLGPKIESLEDQTCICIFDEATRRTHEERTLIPRHSPDLITQIERGTIVTAPTMEELAGKLGVDANGLRETVSAFNHNAEMGVDPEFGRKLHLVPFRESPFYAMRFKPTYAHTNGGVKINTKGQAIDVFGDVIPRLYAAGETTGGHVGRHQPSSGYMLTHCFAFGRIAGRAAAGEKPWEN